MRLLTLILLCLLVANRRRATDAAAALLVGWESGERVLFPEQIEYLRLQLRRCRDPSLVLWVDGRCYREREMGPCFPGRVLELDRKLLRPYCRDEALIGGGAPPVLHAVDWSFESERRDGAELRILDPLGAYEASMSGNHFEGCCF